MTDEEIPRLRDRNWFFHLLSNSDQDTYERERPRWKERRRREKQIREEKTTPSRPTLALGSLYLQGQVEKDKKARRACWLLTRSSKSTRKRISHAKGLRVNDEAARVVLEQHERKIAKGLRKVRKQAAHVNWLVPGSTPFKLDDVAKLHLGTEVDDKARNKRFAEISAVLGAFERKAVFIRRDIRARKKRLQAGTSREA